MHQLFGGGMSKGAGAVAGFAAKPYKEVPVQ